MTIPMWFAVPFVKDVLLNDDNDQNVKPGRDHPGPADSVLDEKKKAVTSDGSSHTKEVEDDDTYKSQVCEQSKPKQTS